MSCSMLNKFQKIAHYEAVISQLFSWFPQQISSLAGSPVYNPVLFFPHSSVGKESACSSGDLGSISGLGRSPGEGHGNPLQCSCLENPMDRGTWWATIHRVAKSQTRLSDLARTQGLVHVYACSPVLHKHESVRVRVHTAACGGDGRKARMRDPGGLWG